MSKKQILFFTLSLVILFITGCNNDNAMEGMNVGEGQISSDYTAVSSEEFPHTKPIQVQHAKYDFEVVQSAQLTRNEIERLLPPEIVNHLPRGIEQFSPEEISRLLPEGVTQLTPEEIAQKLRAGTPTQQPGQGAPRAETPQQQQPEVAEPPRQTAPEQQTETPQEEARTETEQQPTQGITDLESQVIELTNVERRNNGLPDLQADASLSHVAREKSNDMQQNNYFSHTSPTYGSPFDMMRDFNVSYNSAGENIAQGQRSPQEVVQAWMNSEGHRANILNAEYTHIGVGYQQTGHYWTQMFISR
ncbi:CAP domain-containing protein [Halalkalibacter akibai]|uniref:Transporter n=1 Tax=Halalkalibacter akibai (strain ATCC 43226 / DSM 21942 / CIP 109018 / JCM 9157 / 1139) TaxID=1236973 RepID=W4QT28_HALA3|nr:CAP domain-containing protein [Halalkalibacter akibai]GAE35256.1 transporter [Halalkalibacter akibai JCM 9157]